MKTYKGNRKLEDIIKIAKGKGWKVDTEIYDNGGDWIWLRDFYNKLLQVAFNVFNGHFIVYSPVGDKPIATHLSNELDNEDWYNELLDMFYKEEE